jgi:multidrug efflux pump subunit AcrB
LRPSGTRPELRFYPNREAAAFLGVSAAQMAESLYAVTGGLVVTRLEIEGRPLEVRVLGKEAPPEKTPEIFLGEMPAGIGEGGPVALHSLSRIERRDAEAALARLDRGDVVYLDAVPAAGAKKDFTAAMTEIASSPAGVTRADESAFTRYRSSLLVTVCLVFVLLYITMGAQFESFSLPLIFMLTIPFSLAGAGPALFLAGAALDSGAVIGLAVLFGLAVNNGLLLYEASEEKIGQKLPPLQAVYSGARGRIRPILITTATTIFALLPLVITPLGSSQKSMAAAMLGGIAASTLLSLFVLPPVFAVFFRGRTT